MKRILSLDGGGIRGVFTLQILAKIEQLFREERKNNNLVLADVFDFIAGTSTGAIIATGLSWGMSVAEIEASYIQRGHEMFIKGSWMQRLKSKYKSEAIARYFRELFAEADGTPALLGSEKLRTLLLIVMRNGSSGSAWPVCNNPQSVFNDRMRPECNLNIPLWRLLRASTAAPTYFPPEEINIAGANHVFMDGGVTAYNNPTLIAVAFATLPCYRIGWAAGLDKLHVISVGTGLSQERMPGKPAANINLFEHLTYVSPALIGSIAWEQDFICRILGDCVHGADLDSEIGNLNHPTLFGSHEQKFTYARYDAPLDSTNPRIKTVSGGQILLDDLTQIPLLQELGREYADQHVRMADLHPRATNLIVTPGQA